MRKKMANFIFIFVCIISLVVPNIVSAFSFSAAVAVGAGAMGALGYIMDGGVLGIGTKVIAEYEPGVAIYDKFVNNIPVTNEKYYVYDYTIDKGLQPGVKSLYNVTPYMMRITLHSKRSNEKFIVFLNTKHEMKLVPQSDGSLMIYSGGDAFFQIPINSHPDYGEFSYLKSIMSLVENGSYWIGNSDYSTIYENNNFYISSNIIEQLQLDITFSTNFDFYDMNGVKVSEAVTSFEYETDREVTLTGGKTALFIPKKTTPFSSYIYSDNNFQFQRVKYENGKYVNLDEGYYLTSIDFTSFNSAMRFFRWEFNFTQEDINNGSILSFDNPNNDKELVFKYNSSDYEVRIFSQNSGSWTYNGITYSNPYQFIKDNTDRYGLTINNKYSNEDYNDGLSFIKDIPNMIQSFVKSFAFIGTLFATAFSIFTGDILNYFYIVFGILIIMLIIKVLK